MEVADKTHQITNQFHVADNELLEQRKLMKRIDQKYILPQNQLNGFLELLQNDYAIVVSQETRIATYRNQYFDTRGFKFLTDHHRGRKPRHKIRIRHYIDRKISMLESKKKIASGLTVKSRKQIPFLCEELRFGGTFAEDNSNISKKDLHPGICNQFRRISLLGIHYQERLTIDTNLLFSFEQQHFSLPKCVIIETKRHRLNRKSPLRHHLRKVNAYPLAFSKYCTAGYFLIPSVKMNLYRPKIKLMRKILNDSTF
jgi:hypothetical protein